MKESMMKIQVTVCTQMNKLVLLIPLFFITMCGEAPVTPPAQACSPRLDGKPTYCPDERDLIFLKREEPKGEIDVTNPHHLHGLQMMFQRNLKKGEIERNARRTRIEQNATLPSDAINSALDDFMEAQDGSDGSTKQEKLL